MKLPCQRSSTLVILVLLATAAVPSIVSAPVSAQSSATVQIAQRRRRPLSWRTNVRPTRTRIGALSRTSGLCAGQPVTVMPFSPPVRKEEKIKLNQSPVDATISGNPTFWVYLSSIPEDTPLQFTLQNESGTEEFYQQVFSVNGSTGIMGVPLPKPAFTLQEGKIYRWQLAVQCDPSDRSADLIASGFVKRIPVNQITPAAGFDPRPLIRDLSRATDRDKPALYAALGLWQDTVTTLAELRKKQPNDRELKEDWRSLLAGAQMSGLVDAAILSTTLSPN